MSNDKICSRCVMDTTDPDIIFDNSGICNYCIIHNALEKQNPLGDLGKQRLNRIIEAIKKDGKNKKYDCIVGVSGGTDSSYLLYWSKNAGLRPLAVHLDNGWNTEKGTQNIKKITEKLGVELYTHKLNWDEFKNLQLAFLKSSTPDIEIPSDIAIRSIAYRIASKYGIKYVINGMNFRTEGKVPIKWSYGDGKYLNYISKHFGNGKLSRNFPQYNVTHIIYYHVIRKIKQIRPLNMIEYDKEKTKYILKKEFGWEDYGGHHYESIYTRFTQGYYLPTKFNFDKRKVEYSAFIRNGKMNRDEALRKLKEEPPCSEEIVKNDILLIKKKFELSDKEFDEIMSAPPKLFIDYPNNFSMIVRYRKILKYLFKFFYKTTPKFLLLLDSQNERKRNSTEHGRF